jgi:ABC-type phosphate transport system permease subunit
MKNRRPDAVDGDHGVWSVLADLDPDVHHHPRHRRHELALFTEMTPPPNTAGGGLANALAGSGLLILWATVFGTPLGILAGIYLAEYGRKVGAGRKCSFY